jgi:hypothetical protein
MGVECNEARAVECESSYALARNIEGGFIDVANDHAVSVLLEDGGFSAGISADVEDKAIDFPQGIPDAANFRFIGAVYGEAGGGIGFQICGSLA